MSNKVLLSSLALATVFIIVALLIDPYQRARNDRFSSDYLLPELRDNIARVNAFEIHHGNQHVQAVLRDAQWFITTVGSEQGGYPANFRRVQQFFDMLQNARIEERKTSRGEYYDRLGLSDWEQSSAEPGARLSVSATDHAGPVAELMLGNRAGMRSAQYVLLKDDPQVLLIDRMVDANAELVAWLDTSLIDIPSNRIARVEYQGDYGKVILQRASSTETLSVARLPKGEKPAYENVFANRSNALVGVSLNGVMTAAEAAPRFKSSDKKRKAHANFFCFDGLRINVELAFEEDAEDRALLRLSFAYDDPAANSSGGGNEALAQSEQFNERHRDWAYKVSGFALQQLSIVPDQVFARAEESAETDQ